jgi:hypothetical protein
MFEHARETEAMALNVATMAPPRTGGGAELKRRLRRLARMSPVEIASRALEKARILSDRRRGTRARAVVLPEREGSFKAYLAHGLGRRFFFEVTPRHCVDTTAWMAARHPERLQRQKERAEEILAHRVWLLGLGLQSLGPTIDWHRDPVTGERWPLRFFADYDLVHGPGPDPKVVHELGRQSHLPELARAFYWTSDERYAREAVAQMLSFIEANPVGLGVHWHSSLELALRSMSWMTALPLLLASEGLTEAFARRIGGFLVAQLRHVHRYPSFYTSPNTHLIGEAAAVFIGGCFLGEAPGAARFRRDGRQWLEQEARRQVGADGVYKELSTYYHAYALDFFLLAAALGDRMDEPFSADMRGTIARMAELLAAVARPDGSIPLLGDDDGGSAFPLGGPHYHDVRDLLSGAAIFLGRPDLYRGENAGRALWLFGASAVDAFERAPRREPAAARPPCATSSFREAGYFVQTMARDGREARLLFDAGGMGLAGGGHGHADALSVILDVDGAPVLVDPGTFAYNRAPQWRQFFRGTRAHNTVSVDRLDQTEAAGTFAWKRPAQVAALAPVCRSWGAYLEGEHDGYRRLGTDVIHRRRILAVGSEYWLIVDEILGRGHHEATWHHHLAPGLEISPADLGGTEGLIIHREHGPLAGLAVALSREPSLRVVEGQEHPPQGWVSSRYGEKQPAPVLEVSTAGALPLLAVTVLRPWGSSGPIEIVRREGAMAVRLPGASGSDVLVVNQSGVPLTIPEGEIDAGMLWLRSFRGAPTHWIAAGARSLCVGERRFEDVSRLGRVVTGRGYDVEGGA